ncbi:MAG TPA: amidohydrolase family protein [Candidatus Binataceae bacterium]|nr:amidohydrolase family protein [Candidatus Binataceae bacterium]
MPYDLLIRNGRVVDGSGAPAIRADVAIANGRIVAIDRNLDGAARTIDATDLVVAPGFIDPHTHYDAQICWDPLVTCSSWHGVTTVIMGNCGVGLAPCKPDERDVAAWNLVHVEAIPYDVLNRGITWEWESFPQYLDAAERRGAGINLGFLAPLSPFRQWVMGDDAMGRAASETETAEIRRLMSDAIAAGALGFSLTVMPQHLGYKAQPLACRLASHDELRAYAGVLRGFGRGVIEIALTKQPSGVSDKEYALLDLLASESGRPVTWLNLRDRDDAPTAWSETLERAAPLLDRGCRPQVAVRPLIVEFNLRNPFLFASMNALKPVFGDQSVEAQKRVYADPDFRNRFAAELERRAVFHDLWSRAKVKEANDPKLKWMEWKTIEEISARHGATPLDTFFDLAIADDLKLTYMMPLLDIDEGRVAAKFSDPRTLIGISDGGAHVDMLCNAGYPTYLLGRFVRDQQALSMEHAIRRITAEPAAFFGLTDRGLLRAGMAADITIFDPATIGSPERPEVRHDLPGGGRRLVTQAEGIRYTIVNGRILYEDGRHSGDLPGRVLRSGNFASTQGE